MKQWRKCKTQYVIGSVVQTWKPDDVLWLVLLWHRGETWNDVSLLLIGFVQTKYQVHPTKKYSTQCNYTEWKAWPHPHPQPYILWRLIRYKLYPNLIPNWVMRTWHRSQRQRSMHLSSSSCPKRMPFGKFYILGYAKCTQETKFVIIVVLLMLYILQLLNLSPAIQNNCICCIQ